MKRLIVIVLLAFVAWKGYGQLESNRVGHAPQGIADVSPQADSPREQRTGADSIGTYRCDGRTHCSQMASCAEATYFLKNCPGVKMDGNNDGIPCEMQWCKP